MDTCITTMSIWEKTGMPSRARSRLSFRRPTTPWSLGASSKSTSSCRSTTSTTTRQPTLPTSKHWLTLAPSSGPLVASSRSTMTASRFVLSTTSERARLQSPGPRRASYSRLRRRSYTSTTSPLGTTTILSWRPSRLSTRTERSGL